MIHSIIDVGSNTIRMVIYKIEGSSYTDIAHERDFAGLITYVNDGVLLDEGKKRVISVLSKMADICKKKKCDKVHCFATASLRSVKNIDSVISEIKEKTAITMEIISGEDEAKYDFYGLMSETDEISGIGFDLGGGSCQLFKFCDKNLEFFKSLKIGGQVIYKKFVSGEIPNKEEMQKIYSYITESLAPLSEIKNASYPCVFAMGGAARNAAKYIISKSKIKKDLSGYKITKDELTQMCREICFSKEGKERVLNAIPDRLTTIIPGVITIIAILDHTGTDTISIVLHGVREGYLYEKLLAN